MHSHTANRFDDFANAKTAPGTQIVDKLVTQTQSIEDQDVSAGEIADMNIIADASAIRRRVVGSEN
jgi:hypothetical protein